MFCIRTLARFALVASLIAFATCATSADLTTVRIGVLSYRDLDGEVVNWKEIQARLAKAIPGYRFELRSLDGKRLARSSTKR